MSIPVAIAALGVAGLVREKTSPRVTLRSSLRERFPGMFQDNLAAGAVFVESAPAMLRDCETYQGGATGALIGMAKGCTYDDALAAAAAQCAEYDGTGADKVCAASIEVLKVGKKIVDKISSWL